MSTEGVQVLDIRVVQTDDPIIGEIGAAAARRGSDVVVLVAGSLPDRDRLEAVREVLSDEEWRALELVG